MDTDGRRRGLAAFFMIALMLLIGAGISSVAYNAGVAHGLALSASAPDIEQGAQAAVHSHGYYYGHGWHPFGFFVPILFVFFWFFVARMLFWGGPWRRRGYWRHGYGPHWRGPRWRGPRGPRGPREPRYMV